MVTIRDVKPLEMEEVKQKMYSIREMVEKTTEQRKAIENVMDGAGEWHPTMLDGDHNKANIFADQKRSVRRELWESLVKTPLQEFLAVSGTTGIDGAAYLVADKVHTLLVYGSKQYDVVPLISSQIVEGWDGGALDVNIAKDDSYKPHPAGTGGEQAYDGVGVAQATIDTTTPKHFTLNIGIANELIEDNRYGLLEYHIQQAGKAMGKHASDLAIADLVAAADGDGTLNTVSGDADETLPSHIMDAFDANAVDEFVSNTLITTPEAWSHSIAVDATAAYFPTGINPGAPADGFQLKFHCFDTLFSASTELATGGAGTAMTNCISMVFDRGSALLTGRKHWLKLENYSHPIRDLAGAVVSARQDSVTLYKDAICKITET